MERERAMLAAISRALERRDRTQGHGERVAAFAEAIALRLDCDEERVARLRLGAPIHDLGKVAVPRAVLLKRGPLTPEERELIRGHPPAGARLVRSVRPAWPALGCVLHHHERWDGTGYPQALAGKAIPLEARVLAVADAFDAMTSPRPYRRSLGTEAALEEIGRCAGTQFDPEVAAAFLDVWARGVLGPLPAAAAF